MTRNEILTALEPFILGYGEDINPASVAHVNGHKIEIIETEGEGVEHYQIRVHGVTIAGRVMVANHYTERLTWETLETIADEVSE